MRRPIACRSLTLRLTLLFAAASTAVLLLLGFLVGRAVEAHFEEEDLTLLDGKLDLVRHLLERTVTADDVDALPQKLDEALVGNRSLAIALIGPGGERIFATRDVHFPQALLDGVRGDGPTPPLVWSEGGDAYRGIAARLPTGVAGWPVAVVGAATGITHHLHFMADFRLILWRFVAAAALATGLLGWLAASRGLAPLAEIRHSTAAVTASHLDFRLPVERFPAEIAAVAAALNDMLARLGDSFRRLSEFSSDLAHELRTPVSNLMTETQVALSRARSAEEYREVLASNAEEFDRLARMIGDMLFLAKSDHGLVVPHRERVALGANVRELFDFYEALAEERGVQLALEGDGEISGDRLMLRRALSNLLSNAIRHSPRGGRVVVRLSGSGAEGVRIEVENRGETIPAEHLPRLFDRFYRVDPSRQRGAEGAGLGLAITRSIVAAHGGAIEVASEAGVTRFRLSLPAGA